MSGTGNCFLRKSIKAGFREGTLRCGPFGFSKALQNHSQLNGTLPKQRRKATVYGHMTISRSKDDYRFSMRQNLWPQLDGLLIYALPASTLSSVAG
jgi:hypothetical protein